MIFSHGLGGTRNSYAHLVGSIASYGTVVFAIEHRDGSAPTTFIRQPAEAYSETLRVPKYEGDDIPSTPASSASSTREDNSTAQTLDGVTDEAVQQKHTTGTSHGNRNWTRIDYVSHPHELTDATAKLRNNQFEM